MDHLSDMTNPLFCNSKAHYRFVFDIVFVVVTSVCAVLLFSALSADLLKSGSTCVSEIDFDNFSKSFRKSINRMTVAEFFGCTFIAFGAPFSMFVFTIANDPIRIIILIAAAFFWLLSLLASSLIWFALVPLREILVIGVIFSVLLQEGFRYVIYRLLRKTEQGLQAVTDNASSVTDNKHILAYVSGLGFGIISAMFAMVNILADMVGPGTMGLKGGSELFFITSSIQALSIVLLHTFWSIIFFNAFDTTNYLHVGYVVGTHLFVSLITLLNANRLYAATLMTNYIITILTGMLAFKVAGGSLTSLKRFIKCQ